jgi:hypothetical protein
MPRRRVNRNSLPPTIDEVDVNAAYNYCLSAFCQLRDYLLQEGFDYMDVLTALNYSAIGTNLHSGDDDLVAYFIERQLNIIEHWRQQDDETPNENE